MTQVHMRAMGAFLGAEPTVEPLARGDPPTLKRKRGTPREFPESSCRLVRGITKWSQNLNMLDFEGFGKQLLQDWGRGRGRITRLSCANPPRTLLLQPSRNATFILLHSWRLMSFIEAGRSNLDDHLRLCRDVSSRYVGIRKPWSSAPRT